MDLSWSSDGSRVGQSLGRQQQYLRTVISSNYHKVGGMKSEITVASLDVSKPLLILEKACLELKDVTTEELVALQARGEGYVSTIYDCILTDATLDGDQLANASYEMKTLHLTLSLLRVNSNGLLLIRVLIGTRTRRWLCVPLPSVIKLLGRCKQSYQGIMKIYYRM